MKEKRKRSGPEVIFFIVAGTLFICFLLFGIRMIGQFREGKKLYQSVVSLEGLGFEGDPEEELGKIPGLHSFTPVIRIPVRLKVEEYTMDVTWTGVKFEELESQVSRSWGTPLGNTPVLLVGEESLTALADKNGHTISEKERREVLERSGEICWQYSLTEETEDANVWNPCLVAGILSSPSGEIYLPYDQAEAVSGTKETKKFLLTVRGKENYEKALEYFTVSF